MKKLVIILISLAFLVASCTTITERYTGKRIKMQPTESEEEYYDQGYNHYPYYSSPYWYSPSFWMGFSFGFPYFWWDPFYSGYYGYYGGYWGWGYPGRYWGRGYPRYYRPVYRRSIITKVQLKRGTVRRSYLRSPGKSSSKVRSTSKARSSVSKGRISSRGVSTSRSSVSRVKRKK